MTLIAQSGDLRREWVVTVGSSSSSNANETSDSSVTVSSDTDYKESGHSVVLLASVIGALLVLSVVAIVLIKQKRNHPNP